MSPTTDEVVRDLILKTLAENGGHRLRTAAELNISVRTLRNKLHRYRAQGFQVTEANKSYPRNTGEKK